MRFNLSFFFEDITNDCSLVSQLFQIAAPLYGSILLFIVTTLHCLPFGYLIYRYTLYMDREYEEQLIREYATPRDKLQSEAREPAIDLYVHRIVRSSPNFPAGSSWMTYAMYDDNDTTGLSLRLHLFRRTYRDVSVHDIDSDSRSITNAVMCHAHDQAWDFVHIHIKRSALDRTGLKNNIYAYGRPLAPIGVTATSAIYAVSIDWSQTATHV